ncbi:SE1561 family protein [Halobacillus campisalis]|uniref:SE1561 family protein n=1 Tax=Halobacillus campisalis TaxID=435909 RepID=A0ABW2K7R7_9BACI|nr:SE1561 family protein [Halobacillus campisalis]
MTQQEKLSDLKLRLNAFIKRLDDMEPEETSVEDIDELIKMLEDVEKKI